MAASIATRTAFTRLSTFARLAATAAASPLRRFSSKGAVDECVQQIAELIDSTFGIDNFRPNRTLTAYQMNDGVWVRIDAPGLGPDELKVWREDGAVVFDGMDSVPRPGDPCRDVRGVVVVPPSDNYRIDETTAVVMSGCLVLVLKRKVVGEVEDPRAELVDIKVE